MSELLEKSIKTLELPAVLELLAAKASSEEAKDRCRKCRPETDLSEVELLQNQTEAAREMVAKKGAPSFSGLQNIADVLSRADRGGICGTRELLRLAGFKS